MIILISIGVFFLQFGYERAYHPHMYYQVYLDDEVIGIIESKDELDEYINRQGALIRNQVGEYRTQLETLEVIDSVIKNKVNTEPIDKEEYLALRTQYKQLSDLVSEEGVFLPENRKEVTDILNLIPNEYKKGIAVWENTINNYQTLVNNLETYFVEIKKEINYIMLNKQNSLGLTETENYHFSKYFASEMNNISYIKQVYMQHYVETNRVYEYVKDIYSPLGINVKKINTYHAELSDVAVVYEKIIDRKPCTIEGYQFRIKKIANRGLSPNATIGAPILHMDIYSEAEDQEDLLLYVTDPMVFEEAVEKMEVVFVGDETFRTYKSGRQEEIKETGTYIMDVYVDEGITVRKTHISVKEMIFSDASELSSYLLYGENKEIKTVKASSHDSVTTFAYKNGISVEEFFLSNPTFTSINNIFYDGQEIVIAKIDPKISVVIEKQTVEDREIAYDKIEQYDPSLSKGTRYVTQSGSNGVERVSQNIKIVNGTTTFVDTTSNVTIKGSRSEITLVGTRNIPSVGSLGSWGWPADRFYGISSYYGYRLIFGRREFHKGIDIGARSGAPVYASNNGVIIAIGYDGTYGYRILIDHNNGWYTLYAHLSRFATGISYGSVVARGQTIGYVGSSGRVTGPHLHFEIKPCTGANCHVDPLPLLTK